MVNIIADLHLHSKYSRAVSPQMILPNMAEWGIKKGINLLGTGDFTHPLWFKEIKNSLQESSEGIYTLNDKSVSFLLSVEISCVYKHNGKGRRIHNLVFAPSIEIAEKINKELIKRGCNLSSDGRPIIGLSSKNLLQLILEIDKRCILIPCHIWTPWFGIYGALSGYNNLNECFEELTPYVYGIETGISSDPEMNWQIKDLAHKSILSFSDAHSLSKMGRELTAFEVKSLTYENIRRAIMSNQVAYTVEFYPEEGKYHYAGHRNCKASMNPEEQKQNNNICPVCGKKVTDGVLRRVEELSVNDQGSRIKYKKIKDKMGANWIYDLERKRPPFIKLVPLNEIIAQAIGSPVASNKVKVIFDNLITNLVSEINILLRTEISKIKKYSNEKIALGVEKVRKGEIIIKPGYDGAYGVVEIWNKAEAQIRLPL